jgi:hypothetical protein
MHKYIILFFLVSLFLASCGSNDTPEGILKKPQMLSLLTDIHILDGELYNVPQQSDSLYKYGTNKYKALFKRHHTTDAQFRKSLDFYSKQPEVIQEMYDSLAGIVQKKIDSLNKKSPTKLKNAVP